MIRLSLQCVPQPARSPLERPAMSLGKPWRGFRFVAAYSRPYQIFESASPPRLALGLQAALDQAPDCFGPGYLFVMGPLVDTFEQ